MKDYSLRKEDLIPFVGMMNYLKRNGRYHGLDCSGDPVDNRASLLFFYSAAVGLGSMFAIPYVLEGLEKLLK